MLDFFYFWSIISSCCCTVPGRDRQNEVAMNSVQDNAVEVRTIFPEDNDTVVLLIDCADKRFALDRPAAEWVADILGVSPYVMTRPGPVRYFQKNLAPMGPIADELGFYLGHGVSTIIVNAHDDCLANPEARVTQEKQLATCIKTLRNYGFAGRVVALYTSKITDRKWLVNPVWDTTEAVAPCP